MQQIRLLTKDEIECRVAQVAKDNKWCSVLLYKDARVDMRILDETFGAMNWQRKHDVINGNLYCTVSVWDAEKGQWVSKQDVGTESLTEKEKGQASDSFKRACFNIGIGRELYSAPQIFITLTPEDLRNNKVAQKFHVTKIDYTDGNITSLEIADRHDRVRFVYRQSQPKEEVMSQIEHASDVKQLAAIFNSNKAMQADPTFIQKLKERKEKLI